MCQCMAMGQPSNQPIWDFLCVMIISLMIHLNTVSLSPQTVVIGISASICSFDKHSFLELNKPGSVSASLLFGKDHSIPETLYRHQPRNLQGSLLSAERSDQGLPSWAYLHALLVYSTSRARALDDSSP